MFKIGDSALLVDQDGDITIKAKEFRVSEGLWELLTRKRVNKEHVTSEDLRTYKNTLLLTNAHLKGYQSGGVINVSRGKKFRESIAPLFARPKCRCVEAVLLRAWKNTNMSARPLYYKPEKTSA